MATRPHLKLRLELIARLPEPILLERLRALPLVELKAWLKAFGPRECRLRGRCRPRRRKRPGDDALMVDPPAVWSKCRCRASRQVPKLAPEILDKAVGLALLRLAPREYAERPPDELMVSPAETTEAKSFDLAKRETRKVSLWHGADFLNEKTFDDDQNQIVNLDARRRNGDRMRYGARILGTVTRRAA
jgi:hypothetical protein